nr:hypothetical protein Iba_chr02bCG13690 [Ipomoea batatas]GMD37558.1 hypothetical protein Iba_scaffold44729CG0010 [Ipomoea batatas]
MHGKRQEFPELVLGLYSYLFPSLHYLSAHQHQRIPCHLMSTSQSYQNNIYQPAEQMGFEMAQCKISHVVLVQSKMY